MKGPKAAATPVLEGDANVSIDVDALNCYRRIHGLEEVKCKGGDPLWTKGLRRATSLLAEVGIGATFFVVGRDLEESVHHNIARELVDQGHEVANHTLDHPYDLRHLSRSEIARQIEEADRSIEEATGQKPVGFRTPGYNVDAGVIACSRRAGHRYDASIFSCLSYWMAKAAVMRWRRLRGDESGSSLTDPRTLLAPGRPYFPDRVDCWRASSKPEGYVEIPMATTALRTFPIIGTSLHLMGVAGIERLWPWLNRSFPHFFSLEMHAIDFVDARDVAHEEDAELLVRRQPDLRIPWTKKRERYRLIFTRLAEERCPVTLAQATASVGGRGVIQLDRL